MDASPKSRISIVGYGLNAYNAMTTGGKTDIGDSVFSNDIAVINASIATLNNQGTDTYIQGGLRYAKASLKALTDKTNAQKIVVFTDGAANRMLGIPLEGAELTETIKSYTTTKNGPLGIDALSMPYRMTKYQNEGPTDYTNEGIGHGPPTTVDVGGKEWIVKDDLYGKDGKMQYRIVSFGVISEAMEIKAMTNKEGTKTEIYSVLLTEKIADDQEDAAGFTMINVASDEKFYEAADSSKLEGLFVGISKEIEFELSPLRIIDPMNENVTFMEIVDTEDRKKEVIIKNVDSTDPTKGQTLLWNMALVKPVEIIEAGAQKSWKYSLTYKVKLSNNVGSTPTETNGTTTMNYEIGGIKYDEDFKVPKVQSDKYSPIITFNPNFTEGAVPKPTTQGFTKDVAINLSKNDFIRPGYDFVGWKNHKDGTKIDYTDESEVTLSGSTNLYAHWTPKTNTTYTVKTYLQMEDGKYSDTPSSQKMLTGTTEDKIEALEIDYPTVGYKYSKTQSETEKVKGTTVTETGVKGTITGDESLVLKLYYEKIYKITYDKSGATSGTVPNQQTGIKDEEITISGNTGNLEKSGHTFDGWTTNPNGTGTLYGPGETEKLKITGDIILYPKWVPKTVKDVIISYNGNGNTIGVTPNDKTIKAGGNVTVEGKGSLEKDGFSFVGWNLKSNGTGKFFPAGIEITDLQEDVKLYAIWEKISNGGGGNSGSANNKPKPKDKLEETPELNKIDHNAYLTGYPDVTFRSDAQMTRAEVGVMFSNLLLDTVYDQNYFVAHFIDIKGDEWFANKIGHIASLGIMTGDPDGSFRPNEPITRAEFATVASKFDELKQEAELNYGDLSQDHWARKYIALAVNRGWLGGYPDGSIKPDSYITRAEVATVTDNMLERYADKTFVDKGDNIRVFTDLKQSHWAYYNIMEAVHAHDYEKTNKTEQWLRIKAPK